MKTLKLVTLVCGKCSHHWIPRKLPVYLCPKCHTPKWAETPK